MRRMALLGVVLAGLLAGTAQAAPFTPELEADYASALAWWGVASPPQCSSVTEELLPADPFGGSDGGAGARATEPEPGTLVSCQVMVIEGARASGCFEEVVLRHEVGHLLGYGHSNDPLSVMAPTPDFDYWCPVQAQEENARVKAENQRERQASWKTWRTIKRTCQGSHQSKCWAELRYLAKLIRG